MIKMFIAKWKMEEQERKEKDLQLKVLELRHHITKFFEELQIGKGEVDIPAWMECQTLMQKLGINKDNPKIVNYYFKRLQQYKMQII